MAEDFTLPIKVGGNAVMFAPNPKADPHIEWLLRYSTNLGDPHCGRFSAAAVVESFAYLLSSNINMTEATRRLRVMRAAVREHVAGVVADRYTHTDEEVEAAERRIRAAIEKNRAKRNAGVKEVPRG